MRGAGGAAPDTMKPPQDYRSAGVDIDAGEALVEAIKPLAKATARPGCDAGLGGFAALFDLKDSIASHCAWRLGPSSSRIASGGARSR